MIDLSIDMTLFHEVCPALLLDSTIVNAISVMRNDNDSTVVELEFQSRNRSILVIHCCCWMVGE